MGGGANPYGALSQTVFAPPRGVPWGLGPGKYTSGEARTACRPGSPPTQRNLGAPQVEKGKGATIARNIAGIAREHTGILLDLLGLF